jgi:hypothetical protein
MVQHQRFHTIKGTAGGGGEGEEKCNRKKGSSEDRRRETLFSDLPPFRSCSPFSSYTGKSPVAERELPVSE